MAPSGEMNARILIIEDDESLRRGLCDHLASEGWEVKGAKDCLLYTSDAADE